MSKRASKLANEGGLKKGRKREKSEQKRTSCSSKPTSLLDHCLFACELRVATCVLLFLSLLGHCSRWLLSLRSLSNQFSPSCSSNSPSNQRLEAFSSSLAETNCLLLFVSSRKKATRSPLPIITAFSFLQELLEAQKVANK